MNFIEILPRIVFTLLALAAFGLFGWQFRKIWSSIGLGLPQDRKDRMGDRINRMLLVAFGQQKMFKKPLPAILHGFVYVGFLVINIELLEIVIDGIFGTHRVLSFMGPAYDGLMAVNEVLGFLVVIACIILLYRRNVLKIKRFQGPEMRDWPKLDANIILIVEIVLMACLYMFNIADVQQMKMHAACPFVGVCVHSCVCRAGVDEDGLPLISAMHLGNDAGGEGGLQGGESPV